VDNSVYDTIKLAVDGNFSNDIGFFDVASSGVALADYHAASSSIPDDVKSNVSDAESGLADGSVSTGVGPMGHMEDEANKVEASCFNGETGEAMDCCLDDGGYPIPSWSCG
jgi:basic membrane lipoprotein Med (substrate-binding protein (PBP1-ABC) superfamily)